jgi:hypothetical protein
MMTTLRALLPVLLALPLLAQDADDPVTLSTDHPRLLLRPARLRLLKRERERASMRWQQFEALVAGNAPMPEPGFAWALYYQVSGDAAAGRRAVEWAAGPATDLRQLAFVFDWCRNLLTPAQSAQFTARLLKGISAPPRDSGVATARSRALAAIALFDEVPQGPQQELERLARQWWRGSVVPNLKAGHPVVKRNDAYPLFELLHAFRDNANLDLRELAPRFFKEFPIEHLLSYYPTPIQAPETEYFLGVEPVPGTPDLNNAALSRAAELAMVAYDTNGPESQVLQGWLMHDRFILKSPFGAPYEFLWANPYQPGLSYFHVPLVYYNPDFGTLFIRSSWDETARWFGAFDGAEQLFEQGRVTPVTPAQKVRPLSLTEAVVCFGEAAGRFRLQLDEEEGVFVLGLRPRTPYLVEIDDEEVFEASSDPGGILALVDVPRGREFGLRIRPAAAPFQ